MGESSRAPAISISEYSKCEVRGVIRFLAHEGVIPAEIHHRLVQAYGPDVMNRQNVAKWVREFREGRSSVHDEERSGRPSVVTDGFVQEVDQLIREDRRLTLDELLEKCPGVSRTVLHDVISERLGYRKLSARWVPKMLTDEHKQKRTEAGRLFLERFDEQGEEFLDSIVTGDEIWISYTTPETKRQLMQWRHTHSPSAKKFRTTLSDRKVMASVFWNRKGVILVDFMTRGTTINALAYCETLKKLRRGIQNKRRGNADKRSVSSPRQRSPPYCSGNTRVTAEIWLGRFASPSSQS